MSVPHVPGLLVGGGWIPPVRTYVGKGHSLPEIILRAKGDIFPKFHVASFDLLLGQEYEEQATVDLVLVSKDSPTWYLLFVVPSTNADMESLIARLHTASGHQFSPRDAQELSRIIDGLELEQAEAVVSDIPNLTVVTDDPRNDWSSQLASSDIDCAVMVVEPFYCGEGYVIRLNGDAPVQFPAGVIATCVDDPVIASILIVHWTDTSEILPEGPIVLKYGEEDTNWVLFHAGPIWQLQPTGPFPLRESAPFELARGQNGLLTIRASVN